jgi:CubicO group peptidase (beta-lactamase class C family)
MTARTILLLVALFYLAPSSHSEEFDSRAVDALVERTLKQWHVPGVAIAIIRGDKVIYLKGHGIRSVEDRGRITPKTLFPIASCTKSFTTAAMALLVDEGKISWDDPPQKYVPYFHLSDPLVDGEVTLRDLVTHRTGLRDHRLMWYRSPWTQEERIRRFAHLPLDKPFRTTFQYQSTMFTVAGLAVAKASGLSWADFVQKRLLDPLDMKATYFTTTAIAKIPDKASPHHLDEEKKPRLMEPYPMGTPEPAGSIQSNACDLAKWLLFQLDGRSHAQYGNEVLVSARSLEAIHTPQVVIPLDAVDRIEFPDTNQMSYGMGWVIQDHFGHRLLQHGGAIDGFRCHFTLVPKSRLGIVLLCNLHNTRMNIALSNSLLEMLLGLPARDWNSIVAKAEREDVAQAEHKEREKQKRRHPDTRPSRELAGYTGAYEHPAYGTVRIRLEDGRLVWQWQRWSAALDHYHYDTFLLPLEDMDAPLVVFTLDAKGAVARMKVLGDMAVEFKRSR